MSHTKKGRVHDKNRLGSREARLRHTQDRKRSNIAKSNPVFAKAYPK